MTANLLIVPGRLRALIKCAGVAAILSLVCGCGLGSKKELVQSSVSPLSTSPKFSVQGSVSFVEGEEEKAGVSRSKHFRVEGGPGTSVSQSESFKLERVGN